MRKLGSYFLFFELFFSTYAWCSFNVETSLSDTNLEIGDQITYTITIVSDKKQVRPGAKFKPPKIDGLDYMGVFESSSTGISINNFKKTASYKMSTSINYACMKEGDFKIPPIDLDLNGIKTQSITFKVYKKLPAHLKKQQSKVAGRRKNQIKSLFDQFMGNNGLLDQVDQVEFNPEFFTEVQVNKNEIFKGEQLVATWYVYLSANTSLGSFDTLEFPTLQGFWKEDINFATRFYWKPIVKNGKHYIRSILSSYALTPYNKGSLEIDSFKLRAVVSTSGFFNRKRKVLNAVSAPLLIKVKALPTPIPESYFGGVGRFKVDSENVNQRREVLFAESFIHTIRVIGDKANVKFIKPPKIDTGNEFLVYNIEEEYKFFPEKVSSYKDFKYTIVPKKVGIYRLPDIKISFLNADLAVYYDTYVKLPVFKVLPNKNVEKIKDADFAKEVVKKDVYLNERLDFQSGRAYGDYFFAHIPYSIQGLFLFITLGLCFWIYKTFSKVEFVQENLIKQLEQRTQRAAEIFKKGDRKKALNELINIYSLLIGGISGKRFGVEEVFFKAAKNLPPSLKSNNQELKSLNEALQKLRFGSGLESRENQVKLQKCLKQFAKLFLEFKEYLR